MLDVARRAVVGTVGGGSVKVGVGKGKLAKGWFGELVGKRGIRASHKAHPFVPPDKDKVLHSARRGNTRPYGERGVGGVAS